MEKVRLASGQQCCSYARQPKILEYITNVIQNSVDTTPSVFKRHNQSPVSSHSQIACENLLLPEHNQPRNRNAPKVVFCSKAVRILRDLIQPDILLGRKLWVRDGERTVISQSFRLDLKELKLHEFVVFGKGS